MSTLFATPRPTEYAADLLDFITDTVEDTMTDTPAPAAAVEPVTPANTGHVTYVGRLSTGQVITRSTKSMAYTHAVEFCRGGKHGVWSWHKTQAAAVKAANGLAGVVGIVAVTGHAYSSDAAKSARAASK